MLQRCLATVIALTGLLLGPGSALAVDTSASLTRVTFHIAHPAKEYDAQLLDGGADVVAHFDPSNVANTGVDVTIRVESFNSDNTRRDSHMLETLEGFLFPTIDWKVKGVTGAQGPMAAGQYKLEAEGPLTVHGITQNLKTPITMDVAANGNVDVRAEFSISLESFGIDRPTLVFVPIADNVPIRVHMNFRAGMGLFPQAAEPVPAEEAGDGGAAGTENAADTDQEKGATTTPEAAQ